MKTLPYHLINFNIYNKKLYIPVIREKQKAKSRFIKLSNSHKLEVEKKRTDL